MWKFAKLRPPGPRAVDSTQSEQLNTTQSGGQNSLKSLYFWAFSLFCLFRVRETELEQRVKNLFVFLKKLGEFRVYFEIFRRFGFQFDAIRKGREGRILAGGGNQTG